MKSRLFNIIQLVAAATVAAGVMTIFSACGAKEDGTWMNCHSAQMLVFGLGTAMTAVSVFMLLLKNKAARTLLGLADIALAVVCMAVPGKIIHMCMMADMRCHTVMKPFVILLCIAVIVLTVFTLIYTFKKNRKNENRNRQK